MVKPIFWQVNCNYQPLSKNCTYYIVHTYCLMRHWAIFLCQWRLWCLPVWLKIFIRLFTLCFIIISGMVTVAFVAGVIGFLWLLFPLTCPDLYNNRTDNCRCWHGYCIWNWLCYLFGINVDPKWYKKKEENRNVMSAIFICCCRFIIFVFV